MITPRTLAHPPIKEAVLEVLFGFSTIPSLKLLNEYSRFILSKYPSRENLVTINANLTAVDSKISRSDHGFVYHSSDKKTSMQTRNNGFSFAQTNESYTSWDQFKPKAFEELQAFIDFMTPDKINRFSLRFINEIKVPPADDLKMYFTFLPNTDNINLPLRSIVSRVELDKPELGAVAVVSQLFGPPFNPTVNVYLDIDVIINKIPPMNVDVNYLAEQFDALRQLKNEIFFSSLTETAITSYT